MFTARYELNVKLDFSLNWVSKRISYKFPCRTEEAVLLQGEHKVFPWLLTYSMVQNSSWEANWFEASQEIPRILWNPEVHYRTHKRPPTVPILGQPNPVHIPTSHILEIHPNIIHPSTPRSPQWSLSLRFPHQDPIHPPLLTHTLHMPSPSHSSRFYHPHNMGEEWNSAFKIHCLWLLNSYAQIVYLFICFCNTSTNYTTAFLSSCEWKVSFRYKFETISLKRRIYTKSWRCGANIQHYFQLPLVSFLLFYI